MIMIMMLSIYRAPYGFSVYGNGDAVGAGRREPRSHTSESTPALGLKGDVMLL